jgi:hypothetical protein
MSETNEQDGTELSHDTDQQKREVQRKVQTPLDDIAYDAAIAANLNPNESEVVDADITAENELELKLEGPQI